MGVKEISLMKKERGGYTLYIVRSKRGITGGNLIRSIDKQELRKVKNYYTVCNLLRHKNRLTRGVYYYYDSLTGEVKGVN
jgi:hypothetical protein